MKIDRQTQLYLITPALRAMRDQIVSMRHAIIQSENYCELTGALQDLEFAEQYLRDADHKLFTKFVSRVQTPTAHLIDEEDLSDCIEMRDVEARR